MTVLTNRFIAGYSEQYSWISTDIAVLCAASPCIAVLNACIAIGLSSPPKSSERNCSGSASSLCWKWHTPDASVSKYHWYLGSSDMSLATSQRNVSICMVEPMFFPDAQSNAMFAIFLNFPLFPSNCVLRNWLMFPDLTASLSMKSKSPKNDRALIAPNDSLIPLWFLDISLIVLTRLDAPSLPISVLTLLLYAIPLPLRPLCMSHLIGVPYTNLSAIDAGISIGSSTDIICFIDTRLFANSIARGSPIFFENSLVPPYALSNEDILLPFCLLTLSSSFLRF